LLGFSIPAPKTWLNTPCCLLLNALFKGEKGATH